MKYKFTEEKALVINTPSQKKDSKIDALVNEDVLKLVRISKLVQIGLNHEQSTEVEEIKPIKIERLNPPLAPIPIIRKRKWAIRLPKINTQTNMGCVINELKMNKLFLKHKKACEV